MRKPVEEKIINKVYTQYLDRPVEKIDRALDKIHYVEKPAVIKYGAKPWPTPYAEGKPKRRKLPHQLFTWDPTTAYAEEYGFVPEDGSYY